MADINLSINGQLYGGWKNASVNVSIQNLSGSFNLSITDKWPGNPEAVAIKPCDECVLSINGQTLITGYVDNVSPSFDANSHQITITGRDKAADLIDCSVINGTGQYKNQTLDQIITKVCQPFGIGVSKNVDTGEIFKTFNIDQGMTANEAIQKLCAARALLAMSDGMGGILLTRAGEGQIATPLVEGINILAGTATYDYSVRFSLYQCKGQQTGDQYIGVDSVAAPIAQIEDDGVPRYRPLLVIAEGQSNAKNCATRANWERQTRKGKSRSFSITVQGWLQPLSNTLWQLNNRVTLQSPKLQVYDNLLIAGITFNLDEDTGQTTVLNLTPIDAYAVLDVPVVDGDLNPYLTGGDDG